MAISGTDFKILLHQLTQLLQDTYDSEKAVELRSRIDQHSKDDIEEMWVEILRAQGPVEQLEDNTYEIYDISNFLEEGSTSSDDFIHKVSIGEFDLPSSVFMKFYVVFYCLINGLKGSDYSMESLQGGWM